ncbi:MAG TPA: DNA-formamidopyrimidine glycosylase family protein [Acidimicrobiales bacterium]|nr:DNA-formamidopyrimidine glycosylase family protein [Acidimicrobiales bacterium]
MPELPEVEAYRTLAESAVGRRIVAVHAPDAWYLKGGLDAASVADALGGRAIKGARRIGKLLLFDLDDGSVLGLRFGMTGRLLLDGIAGVDGLIYSSNRDETSWDRFVLEFDDGGELRMRDPRRLGGVELDPDEGALGADAATIGLADLRRALAGTEVALKARLLDQRRLAGVGNLIADETLWRAGLDPTRPAGSLTDAELRRLHRHLRRTVGDLIERGGSHLGDLLPHRRPGGRCPRDGEPLVRATVGGRTTWWCPRHQC